MAHTHEYSFCTVCGIPIAEYYREQVNGPSCWNARLWEANAVLLTGPHWSDTEQGPESMKVSPKSVTRRLAIAAHIDLHTIPDRERVFPQFEDYPNHHRISFCIHSACDAIADRVIETSPTAHIRSIGDLWMTLERRCTKTTRDVPNCFDNFLPEIPENNPDEPAKLGLGRYYLQPECFWEDPPSGWWNHDPLHIPDLTTALISNLEQVHVTSSPFASTFASLPQEIADMIIPLLLREPIEIDCNYLVPQTLWKDVFLQIPFLWDLDREVIASKLSSVAPKGKEWNWEKLARQVLSPPKVASVEENGYGYLPWDYKDVGLVVPSGFTNRRRIWQICEDMYPNDVGMEHRPYQPPSNDEGLESFDSDSDSSDNEE